MIVATIAAAAICMTHSPHLVSADWKDGGQQMHATKAGAVYSSGPVADPIALFSYGDPWAVVRLRGKGWYAVASFSRGPSAHTTARAMGVAVPHDPTVLTSDGWVLQVLERTRPGGSRGPIPKVARTVILTLFKRCF